MRNATLKSVLVLALLATGAARAASSEDDYGNPLGHGAATIMPD